VGHDQKQHIELTRDLAIRMINLYGEDTFVVPEVYIPPVGARIMSLQDPTSKMSKSDPDPSATIFLDESDDSILKKLKRAKTDSGTEITYEDTKPGVQNLLSIQSALTGKSADQLVAAYAGKMYGHLKVDTAEMIIQTVGPIRTKVEELMKDRAYLDGILARSADQARERARKTLQRVCDRIGLIHGRYR
jgi:tryptophanyl-tRNA synthetase